MCKAVGKQFNDYARLGSTGEYIQEMQSETGIPVSELIQSVKGGSDPLRQGTWVHPDVAIHLAQWLSPKFAVQVSKWVREWMSGGKYAGGGIPYHLRRYMANRASVPYTHFSVLNEVIMGLIGPMEDVGYTLPETMVPDISQGRLFAKWLREAHGVDTDAMPTYLHQYADGRVVEAKMYPVHFLPQFKRHFNEVWIPQKSQQYFRERDPKALPYLDKMLALPGAETRPSIESGAKPKRK